jgi:hypothetical protein
LHGPRHTAPIAGPFWRADAQEAKGEEGGEEEEDGKGWDETEEEEAKGQLLNTTQSVCALAGQIFFDGTWNRTKISTATT